jgi:hypothetical protein
LRWILGLSLLLLGGVPSRGAVLPSIVGGWGATVREQALPESLERLAGQDAALLRECGIRDAERATYSGAGGQFTVTLYRMRDSTSSYAAYTLLRGAEMSPSDLTEKSSVSRDRVLALVGNMLVDVGKPGAASVADLKTLLASVGLQAEMAPFPTLWQYLPSQGLAANSARYVLGPIALQRVLPDLELPRDQDWIGFSDGAEAEIANYRVKGQSMGLLLARYPTPQAALRRLEELNKWFAVNPDATEEDNSPGKSSAESRPTLYIERTGQLLAMVTGSRSATLAKGLLAHVQFEREIVWNEPSWRAKERPFIELLVMVFVGSGVIIVYLIISSLAFGFFRIAVTKMLPGKVFDRPGELEFLQMRLSDKSLGAKDFYKGGDSS